MKKKPFIILILIIAALIVFAVQQVYTLNIAHSSFENYYKFRGCNKLVEKTDTYATCLTNSGQNIKIVLINGKWYLDGDGPGIW